MKKILVFGLCLLLLLPLLSGCRVKQFLSAVSGNEAVGNVPPQGTSGSSAEFSEEVSALDIDWAAGKVEIVYADIDTVKIEETARRPIADTDRMVYALENGVLTIRYSATKLINIGISAKILTVTLPKSLALTEAELSTASAEIVSENLLTAKLHANTASGDVTLSTDAEKVGIETASGKINLTHTGNAKEINLESASGDMTAKLNSVEKIEADSASGRLNLTAESARELDLETASGNVTCNLNAGFSECEIETASGRIELNVPANADFTADIHTASGDIDYDMPLSKQGKRYVAGNGGAELTLSTASGDIVIRSK